MTTKFPHYSQSMAKAWRRCHRLFRIKYEERLSRRQSSSQLFRGTIIHKMLELDVLGKDWKSALEEYRIAYSKLFDEERDGFSSPEELEGIYLRYKARYADDGLDYQGRAEIPFTVVHRGFPFRGKLDKLPVDRQGRRFVADHKTHKVIPDEEARFSDLQTVVYFWAARENGEQVDGILWDYIRTKPPAIPEKLVKGGLSKRANIDTTYEVYLEEVKKNGLDPTDYADILAKLKAKGDTFFKRVFLPKPSEVLIKSVVSDFFDTFEELEHSKSNVHNLTKDCKGCEYHQICSAEVRGLDTDFIKKQLFVEMDPFNRP